MVEELRSSEVVGVEIKRCAGHQLLLLFDADRDDVADGDLGHGATGEDIGWIYWHTAPLMMLVSTPA